MKQVCVFVFVSVGVCVCRYVSFKIQVFFCEFGAYFGFCVTDEVVTACVCVCVCAPFALHRYPYHIQIGKHSRFLTAEINVFPFLSYPDVSFSC